MLFLSLLFILAGIIIISTVIINLTYMVLTTGNKNISYLLHPRDWPLSMKKKFKLGGIGLAVTIIGMLLTMIVT